MTRKQLIDSLSDIMGALSTVRLDLAQPSGVLSDDDLPAVEAALAASLEKHARAMGGADRGDRGTLAA